MPDVIGPRQWRRRWNTDDVVRRWVPRTGTVSVIGLADDLGIDMVPTESYAVCHCGDARLEWSVDVDDHAFGSAAVGQVLPALHMSRSKVGSVDDHTIAPVEKGDALSHLPFADRSLLFFAE